MGEILEFRRKETKIDPEPAESRKVPEVYPGLDIEHIIFILDTLTSVLKTMPGNIRSTKAYSDDIAKLSSFTEEEIVQKINDASEQSVQRWPKYHAALFDAARQRGIIKG